MTSLNFSFFYDFGFYCVGVPIYTLTAFPSGFIKSIADIVSSHSVKLLDDINNPGTQYWLFSTSLCPFKYVTVYL